MSGKNYTVESSGFQISGFLDMVIGDMGLELSFEILEGQHLHPDLEDPDLLVKFSGPDVDLLLGFQLAPKHDNSPAPIDEQGFGGLAELLPVPISAGRLD